MVLRDHKDLRDLLDLVEAWDDDELLIDIMFEPNGSVKNPPTSNVSVEKIMG